MYRFDGEIKRFLWFRVECKRFYWWRNKRCRTRRYNGLNGDAFPIVLEARSLSMHKIIFWSGRKSVSVCESENEVNVFCTDVFVVILYFFVKLSCLYSTECRKQRELCTVQKKWTNLKLKRKKVAFIYFFRCSHLYIHIIINVWTFWVRFFFYISLSPVVVLPFDQSFSLFFTLLFMYCYLKNSTNCESH